MKEILRTNRLVLREWTENDDKNLSQFLQDPEVMYAYEHGFTKEEVSAWLKWTLDSYEENGYGLWGIINKETNEVIGECGLTNQVIDQVTYFEIGYHLRKEFWHQGYATEAAIAVKNYALNVLGKDEVVSIIRDTNIASMNVAIRNKMMIKKRVIKQYWGIAMPHYIFSVKR